MPVLVAGIHVLKRCNIKDVDARDKPGHDIELLKRYLTIPSTRGNHSVKSGIIVIAISDSNKGMSQGRMATVVRSMESFAILDKTKSTMPRGGCNSPIIRLSVIMTPKCTGSIPTLTMTGTSTGTRMLIDSIGSRKHPTTSSKSFVSSKMT